MQPPALLPHGANAYPLPEIVAMDALELSRAIADREVSCRQVMQTYLEHIAAINPSVNALVSVQDGDALLATADVRDHQLHRGHYRGWLHGMPLAIKDLSLTAGIRTTFGSPLFAEQIPTNDSLMVSRLRSAGAIIIGKTNTPEFGLGSQTYNPVFGATRNAYDHSRTAGGSSGGAAAALAMRLLPVADGSDMMGSLRNPAAYQNIFGFRPSFGRVPQLPAADVFGQQLATEGPMGRTVADVARLFATQAGSTVRAPLSIPEDPAVFKADLECDIRGVRIGWLADWQGHLAMEPGILDLCQQALSTLIGLGCEVEPVVPGFDPERLWRCWVVLRHWAVTGKLIDLYNDPAKREQLKPEAQWEIEGGLKLSALDIHHANVARSAWYQRLRQLFQRFDYLALPSAQVFPFDVGQHWPRQVNGRQMETYHRWMEVVVPGSLSGCPVINMPAGFNAGGLPMGIQLIGPHRADLAVLQLAHAYEQAIPALTAQRPRFQRHT